MFEVNWVAIIIAAVAAMALGFAWYGPLFGKEWMKLSRLTQKDLEEAKKKGMQMTYMISTGGSFVMAFVLAQFFRVTGVTTLNQGLQIAFWAWLGFVATTSLNTVLYDNKPRKLFAINTGYNLVQLLLMAAIFSFFWVAIFAWACCLPEMKSKARMKLADG